MSAGIFIAPSPADDAWREERRRLFQECADAVVAEHAARLEAWSKTPEAKALQEAVAKAFADGVLQARK